MSSSAVTEHHGSSSLPVLQRLVDEQLYARGVLSVKFRVLHGRVVFFRPFVRRRTATTSAASRFVDRVIFVVAATGELVVADADACPKRSVPLRHVTTVLFDAAASTVALLFELSAAEHDIQLVFGPYPPGLGDNWQSLVTGGKATESGGGSKGLGGGSGGRVTFAAASGDGGNVRLDNGGGVASADVASAVYPLMTAKQFIYVVQAFAPHAQVIQGSAASMELKLAKPKHFVDPTVAALAPPPPSVPLTTATKAEGLPSPIASEVPEASLVHPATAAADDAHDRRQGVDSDYVVPTDQSAANGRTKFRDLYPPADDGPAVPSFHDEVSGSGGRPSVAPPPSTPPPPAKKAASVPNVPSDAIAPIGERPSLRDIAAGGTFLPLNRSKAPLGAEVTPSSSIPLQFHPLEPPYDLPSARNTETASVGRRSSAVLGDVDVVSGIASTSPSRRHAVAEEVDTASALRRFSLLNRKADEWNDRDGSATRASYLSVGMDAGGEPHDDDDDGGGIAQHHNREADGPPLLSEMVKKLRARRGEIQMQNLMMDGEIKGLQQRIDAVLESYQRVNPLPELDERPVHIRPLPPSGGARASRYHRARGHSLDEDDDNDSGGSTYEDNLEDDVAVDDDHLPKIMSATKEYNRALNLSLVLLNICRRQRQIHLHAEYDARERWRVAHRQYLRSSARGGGGIDLLPGGYADSSTTGFMSREMSAGHYHPNPSSTSSAPYRGNIFMAPDAALMLRSSYGGGRQMDMQGLISMGF